jgi:hypothetical protein
MNIKSLLPGLGPEEIGQYLRKEIEEGLSPVLEKADTLNEDLNRLIQVMERIELLLKKFEPLAKLLHKIPFLR